MSASNETREASGENALRSDTPIPIPSPFRSLETPKSFLHSTLKPHRPTDPPELSLPPSPYQPINPSQMSLPPDTHKIFSRKPLLFAPDSCEHVFSGYGLDDLPPGFPYTTWNGAFCFAWEYIKSMQKLVSELMEGTGRYHGLRHTT